MNRFTSAATLCILLAVPSMGCSSASCSAANCPGCCDATDTCQPSTNQSCGESGASCAACSVLQACNAGICEYQEGGNLGGGNGGPSGSTLSSTGIGTTGSTASQGTAGSTAGSTVGTSGGRTSNGMSASGAPTVTGSLAASSTTGGVDGTVGSANTSGGTSATASQGTTGSTGSIGTEGSTGRMGTSGGTRTVAGSSATATGGSRSTGGRSSSAVGASSGGRGTSGATSGSTSGSTGDCPASAQLIYAIGQSNDLYSFDPTTTPPAYHKVGDISCPGGLTPFSMAVDRNGRGWLLAVDAANTSGSMFNIDTSNAACTTTSYVSGQSGMVEFGMGFVGDGSGADVLYLAGGNPGAGGTLTSSTLATLDTSTLTVSTVGSVTGEPELTGTNDGQLWGFFPGTTPTLSRIDPTSGSVLFTWDSSNSGINQLAGNPLAWSFASYGGNFWIFLQRQTDASTAVWELNGQTGAVTESIKPDGKIIVGAGVSTCVPTGSP